MKRSQNLEMVDGDERNDMEDVEHEGEDEDHVLTPRKTIPTRKQKKIKIKRMLIEAMAIVATLALGS